MIALSAFCALLLGTPEFRTYQVDKASAHCWDGDTCTFDVLLHANSVGNYGLGVSTATEQAVTLPLVRANQHVRLCDINAPEMHPGEPAKAVKARDDLVGWIKAAKTLTIRVPQDAHGDQYEKYGRLLGYIIADGVNLNQLQLQKKNAVPFIKCEPSQT